MLSSMGLPVREVEVHEESIACHDSTPFERQAPSEDFAVFPPRPNLTGFCYGCVKQQHVHELQNLLKTGRDSTSFNKNVSTKVEVADESSVDSNILQERKEEEEYEKHINILESEKLMETNLLQQNQHHKPVQPSEAEKEDNAEKWLKEDQIEQTHYKETIQPSEVEKDVVEKLLKEDQFLQNQHQETVQSSEAEKEDNAEKWLKEDQIEQTHYKETIQPSEVEKDVVEKLLKEDQFLQNQHQETVQSSEAEKEDNAEKWLREDKIEQTHYKETVQPSEVEKDVVEKLLKEDQILQNQHQVTVQSSEAEKEDNAEKLLREDKIEQTHYKETVLPSEVDKDVVEKLLKEDQILQNQHQETVQSSEAEKEDNAEKWLEEDQIEQTHYKETIQPPEVDKDVVEKLLKEDQILQNQHQETVQSSEAEKEDNAEKWLEEDQIEQTHYKETIQPPEVDKDVVEKLLKEDQILQNQHHEPVQPSEEEKEDNAEKLLKDDQIKCTQQQEAGHQETDLPLQVEGDSEDEVDTNIIEEASKETFSTKKDTTKRLSDDHYKVKSATNDTSGNGGKGTCPADQPMKESGQVGVTLPSLQNGFNPTRAEGDDDDGDDGKRPRQTQLKRDHESEELEKERKKKKKKEKKDKQESQKGDFGGSERYPHAARGEATGAKQDLVSMVRELALPQPEDISAKDIQTKKENEKKYEEQPFGGGDSHIPGVRKPRIRQKGMKQRARAPFLDGEDSVGAVDELGAGMEQMSLSGIAQPRRLGKPGPAGDTPMQQYMLDGTHRCQQRDNQMPPTKHNSEAVKRFYNDTGRQTQISLPPGQPPPTRQQERPRGPPALTFKSPTSMSPKYATRKALEGALLNIGLEDGPSERGAAGPGPGAPKDGTDTPRVCYGKGSDVEPLVVRIVKHNHKEFQEDQDGVLHCKEMVIKNGKYQEGLQYDKLMFLGQGTFGDVFLVRDKDSKMNFVAKRVPLGRFSPNEALIWSDLAHSNINKLLGLMRNGDMVYFFSEYHPSQTLQKLIESETVLGQGRALFIIKQLFEALDWLHGKGIVHKDIKPSNIMADCFDHIWLIDFGESKRLDGGTLQTTQLEGTECYMAPEVARSEMYNGTADVWSGFCTLICAISGDPPWCRRLKGVPVKIFIIGSAPPPLEDVPINADLRVRDFIATGLVTNFRKRPSSAKVLENFPHDLVDELYNVRAIEEELKPPPEAPFGIPKAVCVEPVTPCTPRGPQVEYFRASQQSVSLDESLDITQYYDIVQNQPKGNIEKPPSQPEGDEDLYGPGSFEPGLDMYGPGLGMYGPDKVDGTPLETDIEEGTRPAANAAGPLLPSAPDFDMNLQREEFDGAPAENDIGEGTRPTAIAAGPLLQHASDFNMNLQAEQFDGAPAENDIGEGTRPAASPAGPLLPDASDFNMNLHADQFDGAQAENNIGVGTRRLADAASPLLQHASDFNMNLQADEIDGTLPETNIGEEEGTSPAVNAPGLLLPDASDFNMNLQADEIDGTLPENNANLASPLLGVPELLTMSLSSANSLAAHSFIQDQTGDQHDVSLELPGSFLPNRVVGSVERSSSRTVYDSAETGSNPNAPCPSGTSNSFGVREIQTSGFRSFTSGVSTGLPSSFNSLKTSVTVFTDGSDPIRMKVSSGVLVSDVAKTALSKSVPTPFTLVQHQNRLIGLQLAEFLLNGEFLLDAVPAPDSCQNWLWRINDDGRFSRR
ncbi:uncharacterized protein [Asterias amurensis]|uniref:uncharacterized protein isoform X2 n=1 Tax=Asterias amurensis TaxID=7602 RepID=UPI003AB2882E